jgi:peptide-methionine (S)-S-oxide reductase
MRRLFTFSIRGSGLAALLLGALVASGESRDSNPGAENLEVATFAGGCFWCMEPPFDKLDGVVATTSGYSGGHKSQPTYDEVSRGGTGHAEVVQVTYDPGKIGYADLLVVYWRNVDPTAANRQFCDVGDQYRTGIFYHDANQKRLAEASKQKLEASGQLSLPIVTEIAEAGKFWPKILACRGVPPGLLSKESGALQVLPPQLRQRSTP